MGKSFFEVLEEQIRNELREEIRKELASEQHGGPRRPSPETAVASGAMGRLETWLSTRLAPQRFARQGDARRAYGTPAGRKPVSETRHSTPIALTGERRFHASSSEEHLALELLRKYGEPRLTNEFTLTEIKSAWRRAALKTHPDRFSQADVITQARQGALFRELCDAYEILTAACETPQAA